MADKVEKNAHIFERDELDWYVEPEASTRALLAAEGFFGDGIYDPCCGGGNIVRAALAEGYGDSVGTDIVRRVPVDTSWFLGESDFLKADPAFAPARYRSVMMNPPFFRGKGTEAFIRRGLELCSGKLAVFTDLKFLAGSGRANSLWAEHPPTRVWMITPRPSCPPGEWLEAGNKAGGGTADWIWLVFDQTAPRTATTFHWLRTRQ
ncbi:hypothetical protein [Microvirga brassicacearum]|uniref:Class I SAM-dependent methyltransferase n=1 Tax=Microvirga brassicacearum TaxID=2580413 RepID=A0A5N3PH25_9HYPH|nr:hypothetical protein [Microvirga brassicacearum]KAB0269010.1 hypothetical protein FEZ63_02570 [Microvirga brassicacearum]